MAGKKKIEKEGSSWIGEVEKYSRQIWLAGLGAYSKISNDGSKLFETLVKDGEKAEKQTKNGVDKQVDAAKATAKTAKSRVGDVKDLAMGKWSELEGAFDKRLNSAISRLGVPSRNEVKALHSKVDLLTKQIEKLTGAAVAPASKAAAAKPVAKPAAKPAAKAPTKTAAAKPATKAAAKPVAAKPAAAKAAVKSAAKAVTTKPAAAKPAAAKKPAAPKAATPKPAAKPATTPAPSASTAPAATAAPATTPSSTPASQS
ncbi:phasin family protein [Pseudomonas sp. CCI3.2]|uniref:phasin family protein n=1 Tax=unclassified Pseudomonas TaxID=196821 RepID=UPI002AC8C6D5|nr:MULTISPECIES: phasin family protein [unclassified Pseudomonas]MEB0076940.1 phasin family protein [Pseudomonas sp. MH10out]MEB0102350.1 phasin family protein [Pseudomonas sp. CCI3.2]MEB0129620.1 phasin family protein [Pseudomonas sp. CCI2.4]MEB0156562.1 phasin family protein [Pseudomonas sp. AH2 (2023)]MEB0165891.1 phasin family protein [Pseudomonas sp. CCC4.4]